MFAKTMHTAHGMGFTVRSAILRRRFLICHGAQDRFPIWQRARCMQHSTMPLFCTVNKVAPL